MGSTEYGSNNKAPIVRLRCDANHTWLEKDDVGMSISCEQALVVIPCCGIDDVIEVPFGQSRERGDYIFTFAKKGIELRLSDELGQNSKEFGC